MSLTQEQKQQIITEHQVHATDTGSAEVQVALLTERINKLSAHLKQNKKDYSSTRGLMKMIGQRKRLLAYIRNKDNDKYRALIQTLGIRG
ncbi:MAG: 30S ribosomal protein S15 [Lyngbya sp.]|nr:30S ribosomal protein S15 [Lyngbya sp.]